MKQRVVMALLISITFTGCTPTPPTKRPVPIMTPTVTPTVTGKTACGYTTETTSGPYYVSGAPALVDGNLNYRSFPGRQLGISGYVYEGLDDTTPIPNAIIDIWQADNEGNYHPNAGGDISYINQGDLALRGFVTTNEEGQYQFSTIYPGEYTGRTRHIHIKVKAPGFNELTTQLILPGITDENISFNQDTIANALPVCHLLEIYDEANPAYATFDFRLEK